MHVFQCVRGFAGRGGGKSQGFPLLHQTMMRIATVLHTCSLHTCKLLVFLICAAYIHAYYYSAVFLAALVRHVYSIHKAYKVYHIHLSAQGVIQ